MSLLKFLKEGASLFEIPSLDNLALAIREKVFFITSLIDEATLFSAADRDYPEKISFKSLSGKNNSLGAEINETPDRSMDEIAELLKEKFRPLYPQETDKFDDTIRKMKERQIVMMEIIQELDGAQPGLGQRILTIINNDWLKSYNAEESRDAFNKSIMLMLKTEYEPEKDINDLLKSLHHLMQYWVGWPGMKIPVGIALGWESLKGIEIAVSAAEPNLDLSLAKIAFQLGMKIEHIRYYGRRERDRGVDSGLAKQSRNAPPISNAFWSLKFPKEVFPKGVTIHKAATMVREILNQEKRIDPPPDIKTITNYLKADEKIFELFKPKRVGKKTFLIMQVEDWKNVTSA